MSIYPESVSRLRRLLGWVDGVDGEAASIYIYPESVSRLRRLALVESGWDGGDGGAVSIQLHPESVSRLRRLAE